MARTEELRLVAEVIGHDEQEGYLARVVLRRQNGFGVVIALGNLDPDPEKAMDNAVMTAGDVLRSIQ